MKKKTKKEQQKEEIIMGMQLDGVISNRLLKEKIGQENYEFLEALRPKYNQFLSCGTIMLGHAERWKLYQIICEKLATGYVTDLMCGECAAKMLVYGFTLYDKLRDELFL